MSATVAAEAAVTRESPRGELTTPVSVCLSVSLGGDPLQAVDTPTGTGIWFLDCTVTCYTVARLEGSHITAVTVTCALTCVRGGILSFVTTNEQIHQQVFCWRLQCV